MTCLRCSALHFHPNERPQLVNGHEHDHDFHLQPVQPVPQLIPHARQLNQKGVAPAMNRSPHLFIAALTVTAAACSGGDDTATSVRPAIVSAVEDCLIAADVSASSRADVRTRLTVDSVTFDTLGEAEYRGDPVELVACTLVRLDAPAVVLGQVEQTRALDGPQMAEWGDFAAVWSFHPDDGLIVTVGQRP